TPFADVGSVDLFAFRANLDAWLAHPIAGIVVAGSTGEAPLLDPAELFSLVEEARPRLEGRLLIVGTGAESTAATIAACHGAAERGADAVLVRAPAYYRPAMTPEALRAHFLAVADASPAPVLLYHIPRFVPVEVAPELAARVLEHENVVGMKDSSGDLRNLGALAEACGDRGSVLVGSGALLYPALEAGAVGGILGVALLATRTACDLYESWRAGDGARAGRLQERLGPLHKTVVGALGVPGVKAALDRLGLWGGRPRPPLQCLGAKGLGAVDEALIAAGLGARNEPAIP
ncbi:MAG: dihydrodipicolinate synthase family protein, partial [Gemmatimonadota bacterium]